MEQMSSTNLFFFVARAGLTNQSLAMSNPRHTQYHDGPTSSPPLSSPSPAPRPRLNLGTGRRRGVTDGASSPSPSPSPGPALAPPPYLTPRRSPSSAPSTGPAPATPTRPRNRISAKQDQGVTNVTSDEETSTSSPVPQSRFISRTRVWREYTVGSRRVMSYRREDLRSLRK